jgi:hypothetical protein
VALDPSFFAKHSPQPEAIESGLLDHHQRVKSLFAPLCLLAKGVKTGSSSISVVNRMLAPRLLSARMRAQLKWSPGPGVKVLGITLQDEGNWVVSAAAKPVGICPDCGARSQHRHGWHHRRLQDLPVRENQALSEPVAVSTAEMWTTNVHRQTARDCCTLCATN